MGSSPRFPEMLSTSRAMCPTRPRPSERKKDNSSFHTWCSLLLSMMFPSRHSIVLMRRPIDSRHPRRRGTGRHARNGGQRPGGRSCRPAAEPHRGWIEERAGPAGTVARTASAAAVPHHLVRHRRAGNRWPLPPLLLGPEAVQHREPVQTETRRGLPGHRGREHRQPPRDNLCLCNSGSLRISRANPA